MQPLSRSNSVILAVSCCMSPPQIRHVSMGISPQPWQIMKRAFFYAVRRLQRLPRLWSAITLSYAGKPDNHYGSAIERWAGTSGHSGLLDFTPDPKVSAQLAPVRDQYFLVLCSHR